MEEQYNIKEILIQYEDLVKERESLKESISQIEKRISKMEIGRASCRERV